MVAVFNQAEEYKVEIYTLKPSLEARWPYTSPHISTDLSIYKRMSQLPQLRVWGEGIILIIVFGWPGFSHKWWVGVCSGCVHKHDGTIAAHILVHRATAITGIMSPLLTDLSALYKCASCRPS